MRIESYQGYAMTPDTHHAPSRGTSDVIPLLRALAAAPDWPALRAILDGDLPAVFPSTRVDIYVAGADGRYAPRFSSDAGHQAIARPADSDIHLRYQLQSQGYDAIMIVPLAGVEGPCGWLALARREGNFTPSLQAIAEQIAPLLAVWLRYEQREAELAAGAAREAELAQRLRVTDALRLRATLVAGAAHDIGNLFTTMMGYAQLLQQDLPPPFQNDLQMIVRAVEDGRQLLRRLQGSETAPRAVASAATAGQVIQEVVQLMRPLWEHRPGVTVEMVLESNVRVRTPVEDLREVLVNLIMNAVAALSEDGSISIRSRTAGDVVAISVTDTGHGIAREHQGAIFQPFVTTRSEGSGLGLSVSRVLIERHGGTLTVESEPGRGATFTIFLPIAS